MSEHRRAIVVGVTVSPRAFLAGVVFALVACCTLGRLLSQHNPYKWFTRFHRYIGPQTGFYPTASQVRALARERLDPKKVAVIVGGNSILYGAGQRPDYVWTRRLQELLGDDYCVLNLAVFGAQPAEFGGLAAEILAPEYPKLILLTDLGSSVSVGDPDGAAYRYFYWDAYYKGMLLRHPEREKRFADLSEERAQRDSEGFAEFHRGRRLDAFLYFQDLWTTCALKRLNLTWSPSLAGAGTMPRLLYADPGSAGLPPAHPYPRALNEESGQIVRHLGPALGAEVFGESLPPAGQREKRRPDPETSPLVRRLEVCFPAPTRRRTLVLLMNDSPYFVDELEPAAKAEYRWAFQKAAEVLEAAGFGALGAGSDFAVDDFIDRCHLSEKGGRKLAEQVAPKVRAMAKRLGYLTGGGRP